MPFDVGLALGAACCMTGAVVALVGVAALLLVAPRKELWSQW